MEVLQEGELPAAAWPCRRLPNAAQRIRWRCERLAAAGCVGVRHGGAPSLTLATSCPLTRCSHIFTTRRRKGVSQSVRKESARASSVVAPPF
ncbi:hypothetical protein E2C01_008584 [Portunus trituberculatus]|uniref:Uncharacterized protein n=1 Tax=Portunus trituberculatus TaxID=210409 RepID=A0A5B7D3I6_PORTR|nr:hypothetical protein [Portunus trituberculatus]